MTRRHGRYGRKFNRRMMVPVPTPTPDELPQPAPPPPSTDWNKYLGAMGYTLSNPNLVRNFQRDYNNVVEVGMIQAPGKALKEDNILGYYTRKAIHAAFSFAQSMPKDWIHYAKKAKIIIEMNKPKPKAWSFK